MNRKKLNHPQMISHSRGSRLAVTVEQGGIQLKTGKSHNALHIFNSEILNTWLLGQAAFKSLLNHHNPATKKDASQAASNWFSLEDVFRTMNTHTFAWENWGEKKVHKKLTMIQIRLADVVCSPLPRKSAELKYVFA